jgi:ubiquinone/menaquinone biosynthesis C-methylase UbiE
MRHLGRRYDAYQSFLMGCKSYWSGTLYPQVKAEFDDQKPDDIDASKSPNATYQYYAFLERHLQRMKYAGRYGIVPMHEPFRAEIEDWLDRPLPDGLLALDPDCTPPAYFTEIDIHQHPGGTCGDTLAGVIYDRGAKSMWPGGSKEHGLHSRFDEIVRGNCQPQHILDLGCGFGKSTQAFITDFPEAEVTGIDVSVPCLKLAAATAFEAKTQNIQYRQSRAEETSFDSESFDLVTSTMLLHEMPPKAIRATVAESFRLLEPDGYAIHLDYATDDDPFDRFIHYGHAHRNNEPYMRPLNEMDLSGAFREAGYEDIRIIPFEESPNALSPANKAWRFPWVIVVGRKPKGSS